MEIKIKPIFDAHVHMRQDELRNKVVKYTSAACDICVCMPNTIPMIADRQHAEQYAKEILYIGDGNFKPLVAMGLNCRTTGNTIRGIGDSNMVRSCKLYPAGVTTNSDSGIPLSWLESLDGKMAEILKVMEAEGVILSIHGEKPGSEVLDRELHFLDILENILNKYPNLKVILEHVSTKEAINFITEYDHNRLSGTITLHHLYETLDSVIGDKISPHLFCKPIPKPSLHRAALRKVVLDGDNHFFLGSDSAPHVRGTKECACGCAGVFTAPHLVEGLFKFFYENQALDKLENFTRNYGLRFYDLPVETERRLTLVNKEIIVPAELDGVVPYRAGYKYNWGL